MTRRHAARAVQTTRSILVVEDDLVVAELLWAVLQLLEGSRVTVVHSATAAWDAVHHQRFDALVVDVDLPDMSGIELLDLIEREEGSLLPPVVLTSAVADAGVVDACLRRWVNMRFVAKPFDLDEMLHAVEEAVQRAPGAPRGVVVERRGAA